MLAARLTKNRAFSLIELVIVVVIIGIIAAIAIPRMSRGAAGASDSSLSSNLATLRKAIDLYAAEHDGKFPTQAKFIEQMTTYTNAAGEESTTKSDTYPFGPYLRNIPVMNSGSKKGVSGVKASADETGGWYYNQATGEIKANADTDDVDSGGVVKLIDY